MSKPEEGWEAIVSRSSMIGAGMSSPVPEAPGFPEAAGPEMWDAMAGRKVCERSFFLFPDPVR